MASLIQWTWVWASSGSWWKTEKPGVLQSMGLQRVGHNWVTELNWCYLLKDFLSTHGLNILWISYCPSYWYIFPPLGMFIFNEMATHSNILAWRIPWTEEPGGLQSTGLQRVRHDWATSLCMISIPTLIKVQFMVHTLKIYKYTHTHTHTHTHTQNYKAFPAAMRETQLRSQEVGKVRKENGNPLQYSCLENSKDWRTWEATLPGIAKSWTCLSGYHSQLYFELLDRIRSICIQKYPEPQFIP